MKRLFPHKMNYRKDRFFLFLNELLLNENGDLSKTNRLSLSVCSTVQQKVLLKQNTVLIMFHLEEQK